MLAFVGIAALVAGFAAAGGGYFPTAWGWTALGLMWVAALALVPCTRFCHTRLTDVSPSEGGADTRSCIGAQAPTADKLRSNGGEC